MATGGRVEVVQDLPRRFEMEQPSVIRGMQARVERQRVDGRAHRAIEDGENRVAKCRTKANAKHHPERARTVRFELDDGVWQDVRMHQGTLFQCDGTGVQVAREATFGLNRGAPLSGYGGPRLIYSVRGTRRRIDEGREHGDPEGCEQGLVDDETVFVGRAGAFGDARTTRETSKSSLRF